MENVGSAPAPRDTTIAPGLPVPTRTTAARPRILLVEDDFTLRAYLAELLIQEGYDVVCAADGAEAVGRLQREPAPPAAILLDIMLPRMGGVSFRQLQMRSADLRDMPTVAMTGTERRQGAEQPRVRGGPAQAGRPRPTGEHAGASSVRRAEGDVNGDADVLIVGGGPTGLVLALWLSHMGVRVRIVDQTAAPGTTSRALVVQARTLELYRPFGLADDVVGRGLRVEAINLWARGEKRGRAQFGLAGTGISPYPFATIFPQDEHERLLIERLASRGVTVERGTRLLSFESRADGVIAHLQRGDGAPTACRVAYLAGCDGARSVVRKAIGAEFPGGTYDHLFYVADVAADGPVMDGELHLDLDEADFVFAFPLARAGARALHRHRPRSGGEAAGADEGAAGDLG